MLDINFIRENVERVKEAARNKKKDVDIDKLLSLDDERRALQQTVEKKRAEQNKASKEIAQVDGDAQAEKIAAMTELKKELKEHEEKLRAVKKQWYALMVLVPTIPADDVPAGESEEENVVIYERGEKPQFDFTPKTHVELAEKLDLIDFKQGVAVSGYRGYYLKNAGAELAIALMMYAFHKMIAKGFTPMIPPTLVKEFALFGTGYFSGTQYDSENDEIYQIATSDKEADGHASKEKKFLVGTSEPSLLAYYADKILDVAELPIRVCGYSQCYRSEIGSYGKDTKGLYRVHEFMKVEQVVIAAADVDGADELQKDMLAVSEEIHQELGLPYRKLAICTGDLSLGKYRQFDFEAWMPGLDRWGETGSASSFLDWQSRRLQTRYRDTDSTIKYTYMLNNTVMPTPRPIIAILENFQQVDGSVVVPEVLRPYMPGNKEVITAPVVASTK